MAWLRSNWRWVALNLFALSVLAIVLSQGSTDWNATDTFDPMLESGKWAIRFLLVSLAMTPLNRYLRWRSAIKLRKPAGLWAFGFAALHILLSMADSQFSWLAFPLQTFIVLGLLGLLILTALAITSNRWAMRRLGKYWKRLHRLVYLADIVVICHAMLATTVSKRMMREPQAIQELQVYLVLLAVLLVVRIPVVHRVLKQRLVAIGRRQVDLPVRPGITTIDDRPLPWPNGNGHNGTVSIDKPFTNGQTEQEDVDQQVVVK